MSHNEKPAPETRVPVSTSSPHCPNGLPERVLAAKARAVQNPIEVETRRPDTRSPLEPWLSEGFLIGYLVRHYGWTHQEAGVLRRFRRG